MDASDVAMTSRPRATTSAGDFGRAKELDGIWGWAALAVVGYHVIWETFGALDPPCRNPIGGIFLRGPLAVAIFFVVSGEALSLPFFRSGRRAVYALAVRRYPRLVVPIAFNSLIIWLILSLGLNFNRMAGEIVQSPDWLGIFVSGVTGWDIVRFSLLDVSTQPSIAEETPPIRSCGLFESKWLAP